MLVLTVDEAPLETGPKLKLQPPDDNDWAAQLTGGKGLQELPVTDSTPLEQAAVALPE